MHLSQKFFLSLEISNQDIKNHFRSFQTRFLRNSLLALLDHPVYYLLFSSIKLIEHQMATGLLIGQSSRCSKMTLQCVFVQTSLYTWLGLDIDRYRLYFVLCKCLHKNSIFT